MSTQPGGSRALPAITPAAWLAFVVVCVVWGSTYPAIRIMVGSIPPLAGAGSRFFLAGLLLAGLVAARSSPTRLRVNRREIVGCATMGLLLPAVGNGLVTIAEQEVSSSLTALIVATVPLWIVVFRAATRDRASRPGVLGAMVGFLGLALMLRADTAGFSTGWTLLIVAASVSWALGSTTQRLLPLPRDNTVTAAYEMLFGGAFLLIAGRLAGETLQPRQVSIESAAAWAYLTLAGSLVAFSCYSWLLTHSPLSFVSTYAYINPIVAVLLGAVLLGESLPPVALVGGTVTLVGVMVVVRGDSRGGQEAAISKPARKALR